MRVARPRVVAARPVQHTVFVGGYYYPTLYRPSLYYGGWGYPGWGYPAFYAGWGYGGFYGPAFYQFPVYGPYGYSHAGSVRLQVTPREAEVFVDGYYAGTVDNFDGMFQRLDVEPGDHEVQAHLTGYRPLQQRIYVQPGRTFSIKHALEPLPPGETAPPRPAVTGPATPLPRADDGAGRGGRAGGPDRGRQGGAPQGFGSLSLRVQPSDAEVLLDGERWSGALENERLVVQLSAGTHTVEIRKEGYRTYMTDIPVGNGQTRTLNVALTRQ